MKLTDEQREALKHLVARGSSFPDHIGKAQAVSRVDYHHLAVAAKVLSALLDAPVAAAPVVHRAAEQEVAGLSRHSRAMLLNVLWHHQGGSSAVGQPLRAILGIGQHEHLTDEQVDEAKWIDALLAAPMRVNDGLRFTQTDMERYGKAYADARDSRRASGAARAEGNRLPMDGDQPQPYEWRDTGSLETGDAQ